jgi:hypothetical protein
LGEARHQLPNRRKFGKFIADRWTRRASGSAELERAPTILS